MQVVYYALLFSFLFFLGKLLSSSFRKAKSPSSKLPPGPWKLPIIGSLHHLLGSPPHCSLRDLAKKYGPLMHLKIGEVSTVVISSAKAAEEIMKTHDLDFASRPEILASKLLLYADNHVTLAPYGEYWRQVKKILIVELLSQKQVQSFQSIRAQEVAKLIRSVSDLNGSPFNLSKKVCNITNDITARIVIGSRCKDQETFFMVLNEAIKALAGFNLPDLFPSWPIMIVLTGAKIKLGRFRRKIDKFFDNIINEHKERRIKAKETGNSAVEEDLLDVLLRLQEEGGLQFSLTTDSIKSIIFDLFSGGSETSGNAIEWAMTELLRNPEAMKKAQSEVREAFREKPNMTEGKLSSLNYLRLVIKETLRLHPPVPLLLPRVARRTCEVLGFEMPEKTRVFINAWAIGRDAQFWENAETFEPERFRNNPIDFQGLNFEFIPFGAGRRKCPGISFGLATVEMVLANLLYHFDWKLPRGIEPDDLDMTCIFGVTAGRKSPLVLHAVPAVHLPAHV